MKRQLFFCFGPPKSGTTFLQRLLNLHPEISCPSEYSFDFLIRKLSDLLEEYDDVLALIDRRTGGQGTTPMKKVMLPVVLRATIENMIYFTAGDKRIAGANDNSILNAISMYNNLFHSPKLIVIFRNPVDAAISAWHHNLRLAREEKNPEHEQLMTQYGGFDGWMKNSSKIFSRDVKAYLDFAKTHDNIIMIRYEDLVHDKRPTVTRLFTFLGAS
ncbi:MAG: sulfotransferase, partial [FCB group bacterium]|nr:sulfotransferase [FCB group bacterium]